MTEDFKKFLCDKAGVSTILYSKKYRPCMQIGILIKAMWQINKEGKYYITMNNNHIYIKYALCTKFFYYKNYNSEIEALEKALEYIYKQENL